MSYWYRDREEGFRTADAPGGDVMRQLAAGGVAAARYGYECCAGLGEYAFNTLEEAAVRRWACQREVGLRMLAMSDVNAKAAFEAAESIARTGDVAEIAALQADYVGRQARRTGEQMLELHRLSFPYPRRRPDSGRRSG